MFKRIERKMIIEMRVRINQSSIRPCFRFQFRTKCVASNMTRQILNHFKMHSNCVLYLPALVHANRTVWMWISSRLLSFVLVAFICIDRSDLSNGFRVCPVATWAPVSSKEKPKQTRKRKGRTNSWKWRIYNLWTYERSKCRRQREQRQRWQQFRLSFIYFLLV